MARLIFIVARDRPDLYDYLKAQVGGGENVEVILDRRLGERRMRAMTADGERRAADRRANEIDERLASLGWAVVWRHHETTVYVHRDDTRVEGQ
jgi:hypothetical protein